MNPWGLIPLALGAILIWLGLMGDPLHLWSVVTGAAPPGAVAAPTPGTGGCPPGQVQLHTNGKAWCAPLSING